MKRKWKGGDSLGPRSPPTFACGSTSLATTVRVVRVVQLWSTTIHRRRRYLSLQSRTFVCSQLAANSIVVCRGEGRRFCYIPAITNIYIRWSKNQGPPTELSINRNKVGVLIKYYTLLSMFIDTFSYAAFSELCKMVKVSETDSGKSEIY